MGINNPEILPNSRLLDMLIGNEGLVKISLVILGKEPFGKDWQAALSPSDKQTRIRWKVGLLLLLRLLLLWLDVLFDCSIRARVDGRFFHGAA